MPFQRLQRAQARSWPLLLPYPYVPPQQHVDANPRPHTRHCTLVPQRTSARRVGRRARSGSRRDSKSGSSAKRLKNAEQSKKAFIKQWAKSVRAATEGASMEGDLDEAQQGGNGSGTGKWDNREGDAIPDQRYAARPRVPTTGMTEKSKLTIKSRNCVRHLILRELGCSATDETVVLISFLVLLHPRVPLESREIQDEPAEPTNVDVSPSSGTGNGLADVILINGLQKVREEVLNNNKIGEPQYEVDEIEPPRVLPQQTHPKPGTMEMLGSAAARRAFVHAPLLRSTGMKVLKALPFFSWT